MLCILLALAVGCPVYANATGQQAEAVGRVQTGHSLLVVSSSSEPSTENPFVPVDGVNGSRSISLFESCSPEKKKEIRARWVARNGLMGLALGFLLPGTLYLVQKDLFQSEEGNRMRARWIGYGTAGGLAIGLVFGLQGSPPDSYVKKFLEK